MRSKQSKQSGREREYTESRRASTGIVIIFCFDCFCLARHVVRTATSRVSHLEFIDPNFIFHLIFFPVFRALHSAYWKKSPHFIFLPLCGARQTKKKTFDFEVIFTLLK